MDTVESIETTPTTCRIIFRDTAGFTSVVILHIEDARHMAIDMYDAIFPQVIRKMRK